MMSVLTLTFASSSETTQKTLMARLQSLAFVTCQQVNLDIPSVAKIHREGRVDIILIDLVDNPQQGMAFTRALYHFNPDNPFVLFALHADLDPALIMEALKLGVTELIHIQDTPETLERVFKKQLLLYNRFSKPVPETKAGEIIAVFSPKGGGGATTIALNLAQEIRQLAPEQTVLVLESDQIYSNLSMLLNLNPDFALADLTRNAVNTIDDDVLGKLILAHETGIDFLMTTKNVLDSNEMVPVELFIHTLAFLTRRYDRIILDLPSQALDVYHQMFVEHANTVLVVTTLDVPSIYRTCQYLQLSRKHLNPNRIKLVVNRCNIPGAYGLANKDLEKQLGFPIAARIADDWPANIEANSLGCSLRMVRSSLCDELQKLAANIIGIELPKKSAASRFPFFSKGTHTEISLMNNPMEVSQAYAP